MAQVITTVPISDLNRRTGEQAELAPIPAAWYEAMKAAGMPGGCVSDAFRSRAEQQHMRDLYEAGKGAFALPPGSSQHEIGHALDLAEPARTWVRTHGSKFGWIKDVNPDESWHMENHQTTYPYPAAEERPDMSRKFVHTTKDQALTAGHWTQLKLTDKGETSALLAAGDFDSLLNIGLSGLPVGGVVQVRYVQMSPDAKGTYRTVTNYPVAEVIGTAGGTFSQVACKGSLVDGRRLRILVMTNSKGVKVTSAQVRTDYWK